MKCPVLAIHGTEDEYGSIAFAKFIADKVQGQGEYVVLDKCGHMPHKEQPETVLTLTTNFVNRNSVMQNSAINYNHLDLDQNSERTLG